jgi:hypothetical protein
VIPEIDEALIGPLLADGVMVRRIQYHQFGGPELMRLEEVEPASAKYTPEALETVSRAAAQGKLAVPVARAVPLTQAIGALTELERARTPKGDKLVIVPR